MKLFSLLLNLTVIAAFVPSQTIQRSSISFLNMIECPEIPITSQMDPKYDTAIIALGWFWHPQRDYQLMDGVERVVVGYTGGEMPDTTYQNIKDATEAVLIEYNPAVISYEEILREWSKQHYPFRKQKAQYRSAIFYKNADELLVAQKIVQELGETSESEVCTDIEEAGAFYRAEEYHQDFLNKQKNSRTFYY